MLVHEAVKIGLVNFNPKNWVVKTKSYVIKVKAAEPGFSLMYSVEQCIVERCIVREAAMHGVEGLLAVESPASAAKRRISALVKWQSISGL